jgi:hypothetical protein
MRRRSALILLAALSMVAVACDSKENVPDVSHTPSATASTGPTPAVGELLTTIEPEAGSACEAMIMTFADPDPGSLLAAYQSTAGKIVDWESWKAGTSVTSSSPFSAYPVDKAVSVCLLSGVFNVPLEEPPKGSVTPPPDNRALFLIPEGETWVRPLISGDESTFTDGTVPKSRNDDTTTFSSH